MPLDFSALEHAKAVLVCMDKGTPTPFDDNKDGNCVVCGGDIIMRPYIDLTSTTTVCLRCGMMAIRAQEEPPKIEALDEARAEFDKLHGSGMTDAALEEARHQFTMAKAFSGLDALEAGVSFETDKIFTCMICGQTMEKGRSDEEAWAEAQKEHPGITREDCAPICSHCHKLVVEWEASREAGEGEND